MLNPTFSCCCQPNHCSVRKFTHGGLLESLSVTEQHGTLQSGKQSCNERLWRVISTIKIILRTITDGLEGEEVSTDTFQA